MIRSIKRIVEGRETKDGAGVKLVRVFSRRDAEVFDPFLMLDAFDNDNPEDYMKGFPFHPHRGIETVTYLIEGNVEHQDSLGNKGVIKDGDCQWMTAGSGIIHQEMMEESPRMLGIQIWVNLPRKDKMIAPKYRDISNKDIPVVEKEDKKVQVIAGTYEGVRGPMEEITVQPTFMDIELSGNGSFVLDTEPEDNVFIYIVEGTAVFEDAQNSVVPDKRAVLFNQGDTLKVGTDESGVRFLLFSGKPLREPIAWGGPIVMNTQEELKQAFKEIDEGTFIK